MDNPAIIGIICLLSLLVFLSSGIWVAIGIGIVALASCYLLQTSIALVGYIAWNTLNSFVLTAIPLYILLGELLTRSGLSDSIYRGMSRWLAWAPGGLLHANIGTCAFFAAICGSSAATAAAVGTVAFPALRKRNYDMQLTAGSLAAGGTLGILIPPSITMIVYGSMAGASIGKLFAGGVIPGIILSLMFMIYIAVKVIINPQLAPYEGKFTFKGFLEGCRDLWPILLLMVVVLGSIFGGIATPTEAAAIGVSMSMIIALGYRKLTWHNLITALINAVCLSSMVLFILIASVMLGSVLARIGTAQELVKLIVSLNLSSLGVLATLYVFYLLLGCVMDGLSMVVLTTPIVAPVILSLGIDLVWWGVILVVLVEVGLLTPPVGVNLFIIQGISKLDLMQVAKGSVPFFILMIISIVLFTIFPSLILWLPQHMIGG